MKVKIRTESNLSEAELYERLEGLETDVASVFIENECTNNEAMAIMTKMLFVTLHNAMEEGDSEDVQDAILTMKNMMLFTKYIKKEFLSHDGGVH
jgi:hypothetical protein